MATKTKDQVAKLARDTRDYIKVKNGEIPVLSTFKDDGLQVNQATLLRMMCVAVCQIVTGDTRGILTNTYPNPSNITDNVNMGATLTKGEYANFAYNTQDWINKTATCPVQNNTGKGILSFHGMIWLYSQILGEYYDKKSLPDSISLENKYTASSNDNADNDGCYRSKRYLSDANIAQNTNYWCACNIFQQIMKELYDLTISESVIASAMGTTTAGTAHAEIISGGKAIAQKYGHSVTIEFKNYSSMTEKEIGELVADPDVGIFIHDLYKKTWGHYEYLIGLCPTTGIYIVANSLSGGYIENRSRATMKSYISGIDQPSVGIVRKIN